MLNGTLLPFKAEIDIQLSKDRSPSEIADILSDRVDTKLDTIRRYIQTYVDKRKKEKHLISDDDKRSVKQMLRDMKNAKPKKVKGKKKGKYQTYVVLGCVHRPFHNKKIWNGIMNLISDLRPTLGGIVLNGDYLDLLSLSAHSLDELILPGINLGYEYKDGLEDLLDIEKAVGGKKIERHFLFGNHEARYYKHLKKFINSKYGDALTSPQEGLRLEELGYEVQPDYQGGYIELGNDLQIHHGIYFGTHSAKKHLDMIPGKNCIYAHTHRMQSYTGPAGFTAYNTGCLIDINSPAFSYSNRYTKSLWKNGFSVVRLMDTGEAIVQPIECVNDGFFCEGRFY